MKTPVSTPIVSTIWPRFCLLALLALGLVSCVPYPVGYAHSYGHHSSGCAPAPHWGGSGYHSGGYGGGYHGGGHGGGYRSRSHCY